MPQAKNVGTVSMDMILNSNAFEQKLKQVNGIVKKVLSVAAITKFSSEAVSAATKMQSAWTGLNSIVQGTGKSFSAAERFITQYTKDGLVSINEATTAYKNLLSRGYDTSQIENTMNALKDSAAFGRQASYDLGEAVVSATEGLKNENSILVDNAGVTKNVAKMWEEYAKVHNTTTNALTQAQKIEAEYNGILKETRFQTGDALTYTKTFGGQIQMLKMSFTNLTIAVGKVVTPIAQLFIPVLNSAVVALTNVFNKIQLVLKAFNLEMPNVVKNTSANIAQIGESATNSATQSVKAAKKISGAFSDIDEIHTINTSSNDSGTAAPTGSTSSVGMTIEPVAATDNSVSNAVSATVEKIKQYLEPLQNISFDNLINALNSLRESLSPFTRTFFDGLNWFYFDILVPLTEWTIEDALPAFFDALAGVFSVLNPLLISFKDLGIWLWDGFLQPIANWTGGIIVSVLEELGNKLSVIGSWMSTNQPVVNAITYSVAGFFAAWEIIKLMSFIEQAGGVIVVLKNLATALWTVTGAKIVDKAETIALTALYAKDFIKNIVSSTAALLKQGATWVLVNGHMAIYNVTAAIGSAATTAFGVAMSLLTSPITLVILSITALIGIIVLCVKHWDDIKKAASNCWNGIKSVWGAVSNWFKSKVVNPIKSLFKALSDTMINMIKAPLNNMIRGLNTFLLGINKIKIPDWVPGIGGFRFNFKPIQMLAQGKYVGRNNPQLAIVGDNKREGEVITPESKIYEQQMKALKDAGVTGNSGGIAEVHLYVHYEDGKAVIKKINKTQIEAGEILLLT